MIKSVVIGAFACPEVGWGVKMDNEQESPQGAYQRPMVKDSQSDEPADGASVPASKKVNDGSRTWFFSKTKVDQKTVYRYLYNGFGKPKKSNAINSMSYNSMSNEVLRPSGQKIKDHRRYVFLQENSANVIPTDDAFKFADGKFSPGNQAVFKKHKIYLGDASFSKLSDICPGGGNDDAYLPIPGDDAAQNEQVSKVMPTIILPVPLPATKAISFPFDDELLKAFHLDDFLKLKKDFFSTSNSAWKCEKTRILGIHPVYTLKFFPEKGEHTVFSFRKKSTPAEIGWSCLISGILIVVLGVVSFGLYALKRVYWRQEEVYEYISSGESHDESETDSKKQNDENSEDDSQVIDAEEEERIEREQEQAERDGKRIVVIMWGENEGHQHPDRISSILSDVNMNHQPSQAQSSQIGDGPTSGLGDTEPHSPEPKNSVPEPKNLLPEPTSSLSEPKSSVPEPKSSEAKSSVPEPNQSSLPDPNSSDAPQRRSSLSEEEEEKKRRRRRIATRNIQ